jgi:hypothetical protein
MQGERLSQSVGVGRVVARSARGLLVEVEYALSALEEVHLMLPEVGDNYIDYARVTGCELSLRVAMIMIPSRWISSGCCSKSGCISWEVVDMSL